MKPNNPWDRLAAERSKLTDARVVGLVGGVASGKSTVARMFAELGARVIDADVIAHKVLEAPAICAKLRQRWGEKVFGKDGRPDTLQIAEIVFGNPAEMSVLNQLVHPATCRRIREQMEDAQTGNGAPLIVLDAPMLYEDGLDEGCNVVVFVEAHRVRRASRASASRGWTPEEMDRRESAQMPLDEKVRRADATIDNNGTPEKTRSQVKRLFRRWTR